MAQRVVMTSCQVVKRMTTANKHTPLQKMIFVISSEFVLGAPIELLNEDDVCTLITINHAGKYKNIYNVNTSRNLVRAMALRPV